MFPNPTRKPDPRCPTCLADIGSTPRQPSLEHRFMLASRYCHSAENLGFAKHAVAIDSCNTGNQAFDVKNLHQDARSFRMRADRLRMDRRIDDSSVLLCVRDHSSFVERQNDGILIRSFFRSSHVDRLRFELVRKFTRVLTLVIAYLNFMSLHFSP